jgi:hypothetical protein
LRRALLGARTVAAALKKKLKGEGFSAIAAPKMELQWFGAGTIFSIVIHTALSQREREM